MNWCHLFLHTAHTALCTSHFFKNLIIIQNLLWIYKLYIVWMLYSIKSSINSSLLFICFNSTLNHHQSYSFKNPLSSSSLLSPVERFPTDINVWPFDVGLGLRWTRTLQRGLIPDIWYLIPDNSGDHYVTGIPRLLSNDLEELPWIVCPASRIIVEVSGAGYLRILAELFVWNYFHQVSASHLSLLRW